MVEAEKFSDHPRARGTLPEELYIFMRISRVVPLRMRKNVVQNIKTHFMLNFLLFFLKFVQLMRYYVKIV